jgi:Tfp pilus assembly protein PilO
MELDRTIAIAVIVCIILPVMYFLLVPEYRTFKKLQNEIAQKEAEYNAQFSYYAEVTQKYFELQGRKEDLKKIDDALPETPNLGKLVYYFQKAASENGMVLGNLSLSSSPSGGSSSGGIKQVIFALHLVGSYKSLGGLIASLERSSRIFEVTSISFGGAGTSQSSSDSNQFRSPETYTFTMQVRTNSY